MSNEGRTPQSQDSRQSPAMPQGDASREDQRDLSDSDKQTGERENPNEKIEIGDPVPEDNRTTRAAGETGEDEDLPGEAQRH